MEERELLVWGTTYPEFSKKYYETVCTGAIDVNTREMIRIYPIRLRQMRKHRVEEGEEFRTWDVIRAKLFPALSDSRPESRRIDESSIRHVRHIDTADGWRERRSYIDRCSVCFQSVECLQDDREKHGTSLGIVRPKRIKRIYHRDKTEEDREHWVSQRERAVRQRDLFDQPNEIESVQDELQFINVDFLVSFECDDQRCKGHEMTVRDWGLLELYRRQQLEDLAGKTRISGRDAVAQAIFKLEEILNLAAKDTRFFLGNTAAHPANYMIVGMFYPPIVRQQSLF